MAADDDMQTFDTLKGCCGCKHADTDATGARCNRFDIPVINTERGCKYREEKVKTNGDRIRSMTDEQLAEAISCKVKYCKVVSSGAIEMIKDCCPEKCYECALDWLRKEAEP